MNVIILGSGNIAFHLAPALKAKGDRIIQVYSRNSITGQKLADLCGAAFIPSLNELNRDADSIIVAIHDDAIAEVCNTISFTPSLIVHTSGAAGIDVFPDRFLSTGVLYPVQSFSIHRTIDLNSVPFCIEGNNADSLERVRLLAEKFSSDITELSSVERAAVHLSAVFANNFTNHLYSLAFRILKENKLPTSLLKPLIMETARKAIEDLPDHSQTGPAKRGDLKVMEKHLQMLKDHPEAKEIYRLLSESIYSQFREL